MSMAFAFSSSQLSLRLLSSSRLHLRRLKTQQARLRSSPIQFLHRSASIQFSHRNIRNRNSSISFPTTAAHTKHFHQLFFGPKNDDPPNHTWNFASRKRVFAADDDKEGSSDLAKGDGKPEVAVVLLGWLGAKTNHLKRYVELYNAKGIHAVTFVASVADVLSFDLGKKVEARVRNLSRELVSWLSDDRENRRFLLFHTFSNTGWLAYGAILDSLKERQDLLQRVKGCVVDSGGDPNIDPKVWAAGFATAVLKKNSSAVKPSVELLRQSESNVEENNKPMMVESLLLFAFEKLFSYVLFLPHINMKLTKIINGLSENQPSCPQLYLYSTGDKVIPVKSVESFIDKQRRDGKKAFCYNFGSSPHVDHYRTFPDVYSCQLYDFLKECFSTAGKKV